MTFPAIFPLKLHAPVTVSVAAFGEEFVIMPSPVSVATVWSAPLRSSAPGARSTTFAVGGSVCVGSTLACSCAFTPHFAAR